MTVRLEGPILVGFERFGPYHHARLRAAAARADIIGVEVSAVDLVYAWDTVASGRDFTLVSVLGRRHPRELTNTEIAAAFERALADFRPSAVAVHGWAERGAMALLRWARRHSVPAIVMSDSTVDDAPRRLHKEFVKSRLLRCFDAALVAGGPQRDYLVRLGFPTDLIFDGYDVVDNDHFFQGAQQARCASPALAATRGLPERPYFLTVSRFIERKNLLVLLEAYARYRAGLGPSAAWDLVLIGDGERRAEIASCAERLGVQAFVHLPGFVQYDGLPVWYGNAAAFVHPARTEQWGLVVNEAMAAGLPVIVSAGCGCTSDLVAEGVNGFTFDPADVDSLAAMMTRVADRGTDLAAMSAAGRAIIRRWDLDRFATGLVRAARAAAGRRRSRAGPLARLTLQVHAR